MSHAAQLLHGTDGTLSNPRLGFNVESRCIVTSALNFFAPQLAVGRSSNEEEEEEEELCGGHPHIDSTGWNKLRELLGNFFPSCDMDYSYPADACPVPAELVDAIQTQLQERHMQHIPSLMEKVG